MLKFSQHFIIREHISRLKISQHLIVREHISRLKFSQNFIIREHISRLKFSQHFIIREHISRLKLKYSSAEYNGEYTCVVYGMMEAEEDTYSVSVHFIEFVTI